MESNQEKNILDGQEAVLSGEDFDIGCCCWEMERISGHDAISLFLLSMSLISQLIPVKLLLLVLLLCT
jgi:hypothetical protein